MLLHIISIFFTLPIVILSLENLNFNTNYGQIQFYSKPEPNFVEGEFSPRTQDSVKILFHSQISDGERQLSLKDAHKNVILSYYTTAYNIAYIQIGQFHFVGNVQTDNILHLPFPDLLDQMHLDLYDQIEKLDKSNITIEHALELVSSMQEYEFFEDLTKSLGEVFGSSGQKYPSLMTIYFSLRAVKNSMHASKRETRDSECVVDQPHSIANCGDKTPQGKDCFGMCGPTTTCWDFVCGDCCYQKGCADHDQCCTDNGMTSLKCMFPENFSCASYAC